jgi:hypothetical protein
LKWSPLGLAKKIFPQIFGFFKKKGSQIINLFKKNKTYENIFGHTKYFI